MIASSSFYLVVKRPRMAPAIKGTVLTPHYRYYYYYYYYRSSANSHPKYCITLEIKANANQKMDRFIL